MKLFSIVITLVFTLWVTGISAKDVQFIQPVKPFSNNFKESTKGAVQMKGNTVLIPHITWAGDGPMIIANNGKSPDSNSFFNKKFGFKVRMVNGDDFRQQVKNYISGKSPFLRGTLGMLNLAAESLSHDNDLKPLVFIKYSWSEGADGLVTRAHIRKVKDLKGKTIVLQQYSPHLEFLEQILKDGGLKPTDVKLKFVKEIIEPQSDTNYYNDPANAFRFSKDIDAAFCISPDTGTLTSGGSIGNGAEGSVKGARLLVTSKTARRVIADVLAVRSDFARSNPEIVKGVLTGFLKGVEWLKEAKNAATRGNRDRYNKLASTISKVLLSDDNPMEVKGMLTEVNLSDYSENFAFFEKKRNPVGFYNLNKKYQNYLVRENYLKRRVNLEYYSVKKESLAKHLNVNVVTRKSAFKSVKQAKKALRKLSKKREGVLFNFTFLFKPNQVKFRHQDYVNIFKRIHELSETYGGALVNIIGHGDPSLIEKLKRQGASRAKIKNVMAASKRMTYRRAKGVKKALIAYAENADLDMDETQFIPNGKGVEEPIFLNPISEKQWKKNMRVEVKIVNVESEASSFAEASQ